MNSPLPAAPVAPSPGAREDPDSAGLREAGFLALPADFLRIPAFVSPLFPFANPSPAHELPPVLR
ncbi:MAG: hypothetical protein ACO3G4_03030 [Opitutaceae bacterium]